jgi:FKBP-type peptidyl-prolyl cis-trans isomerase SlyD
MQIAKNTVVSIHYTLRDNSGNIIDSSDGGAPLTYIQGIGNLIPGMEEGLEGRKQGEKFDIKVSPEKGYGTRNDQLIQKVPRSAFGQQELKAGMQFQAQGEQGGTQIVTITEVGSESVTVDGNHPLAGVDLSFAVEVMSVRAATKDELDHGHVHGEGGHNH